MKKINILFFIIIIFLLILDCLISINNINKISANFNSMILNSNNNNLELENYYLKQALSLKDEKKNYLFSIGYFSNLYDEVIIDKGSNDNVKIGSPVLSNNLLVGFVDIVYDNFSVVKSIDKYRISVRVNDEYGILEKKNSKLIISGLESSSIGDKVYTSGLTNVLGDIYIGYISRKNNNDYILDRKLKYIDYKYLLIIGDFDD